MAVLALGRREEPLAPDEIEAVVRIAATGPEWLRAEALEGLLVATGGEEPRLPELATRLAETAQSLETRQRAVELAATLAP